MNDITINAQGMIGDTLYSTYLAMAIYKKYNCKINYRLQYGCKRITPDVLHPTCDNNGILTKETYEFLKPVLEGQEYINNIEIIDKDPEFKTINLCDIYKLPINWRGDNIINYSFYLVNDLLYKEYWLPTIKITQINEKVKNKILISKTNRYISPYIDYTELKQYINNIIFVGTKNEHQEFCQLLNENIEYLPCTTLFDIATAFNSCKFFIGNESGLFALAECMKIPRLLLLPSFSFSTNNTNKVVQPKIELGPTNVCPIGGICETVIENNKFKTILQQIFK